MDYKEKRNMQIGDVFMMKFSGSGSAQNGWRPGVVFQNNVGNQHSPNIIALPFTSSLKKRFQPTHVIVSSKETGLKMDSMVLCENPETMSKDRIGEFITTLPDHCMAEIAFGSLLATGAISYMSLEELLDSYQKAVSLNGMGSTA